MLRAGTHLALASRIPPEMDANPRHPTPGPADDLGDGLDLPNPGDEALTVERWEAEQSAGRASRARAGGLAERGLHGQNGSTVPERSVGRPPRVLTDLERTRLVALGAVGLNRELAAARLGCSPTTLRAIFARDEEAALCFTLGRAEAAEKALELLWKQAKAGNPAAAIFLGKTLAGLRETGAFGEEGGAGAPSVSVTFQVVAPSGETRELRRVAPAGEWTTGDGEDGLDDREAGA